MFMRSWVSQRTDGVSKKLRKVNANTGGRSGHNE
jgi:hypothetical protein